MLRGASGPQWARDRGSILTEFREFQDGEVIAGTRYRVIRLIGVGGMGSVYEVEHMELGKRFVLKALLRELVRREDLAARLRNEWRALARLQHANIVNVTDAGTSDGGVPFYVMERLDGDTLAAHLKQKRRLHVLEAVGIAASVLEALSAAHDIGIIHRDVKPANIFLVSGGGVKLLDFGVAKIADASSVVTARGLAVGTPRYMSPEQARGERVDGRSDVYASGLILFEMIAGVGPFDDARDANELLLAHLAREAPPLSSLVMGVSLELERILLSMLAKDIRARPTHARQIAQQLREFSTRHQQTPATDALTVQAGYGAPTVVAGRPVSSPNHNHTTRPEGILAGRRADPTGSDAALTQPMVPRPLTTQVTLSINTGGAFSVSPAPNTTFVSPPSFDGSTTQQMGVAEPASARGAFSPPSSVPPPSFVPDERVDRTEMLGDFTPPMPVDAVATRTLVPLLELARPTSVTPPPVVDTGRPLSISNPRTQRIGRAAALGAAALTALLIAGAVVHRGKSTAAGDATHVVTASPAANSPNAPSQATPPAQPTAEIAPPAQTSVVAAHPSLPSVSGPQVAVAASGSVPNSPAITESKRLGVTASAPRATAGPVASGLFLRAISLRPPVTAPKARPAPPPMPASGL
jgi:serine/threonine protein kinase